MLKKRRVIKNKEDVTETKSIHFFHLVYPYKKLTVEIVDSVENRFDFL